eukprot:759926-Hanusia_phi.AAC.2
MSLLTGEPAGATVRVKSSSCSVLEVTKLVVMTMIKDRPSFRKHLDEVCSLLLLSHLPQHPSPSPASTLPALPPA